MTYTYETEAATEDERGVKLGVATAEWLRAALGHGIQYGDGSGLLFPTQMTLGWLTG